MPNQIIDLNAPSVQRTLPALAAELPHGSVVPPQEVRDQIAALDEKLLREQGFTMNEEARTRELNRHTLNDHFDYLGHEIAYRETPGGPEVLAVGDQEIVALVKSMTLDEQLKLRSWLP
jgi:hypothetical protein